MFIKNKNVTDLNRNSNALPYPVAWSARTLHAPPYFADLGLSPFSADRF